MIEVNDPFIESGMSDIDLDDQFPLEVEDMIEDANFQIGLEANETGSGGNNDV